MPGPKKYDDDIIKPSLWVFSLHDIFRSHHKPKR